MIKAKRKRYSAALRIAVITLILIITRITTASADDLQENIYEKIIAHGGSTYHGYETTNSVEAINHAIQSGYKIIELDMELSSDKKIIMLHDWDRTAMHYYNTSFPKKISQKSFAKLSVHGKLEVLTFDKLAEILENNSDIRIVTDTKGNNLELLSIIKKEYPTLVKQIIPQIYDYDQWAIVKQMGYSDIIFTLYAMDDIEEEKLISFVKKNDIYAVTMPDYLVERGYCSSLSEQGIKVYVHTVSDYEDALQYMEQGSYGVYSGILLPEEFTGFEKDCYLAVRDDNGTVNKLTDDKIDSLTDLIIHGIKDDETAYFFIDGSDQSVDDVTLSGLSTGKHELKVKIFRDEIFRGDINYFIYKDGDKFRILHKKYEYRLDEAKEEKEFTSAMIDGKVPQEISDILKSSLIAKKGEYIFYLEGKPKCYMNGDDVFPVREGSFGKLLMPLSTTAQCLGADSVTMSRDNDISIINNNEKSMIMINSSLLRKGFARPVKMSMPVVLYLNKAMASGEFYKHLTGRNFIEKEDLIIFLPHKMKIASGMENSIINAANNLFN